MRVDRKVLCLALLISCDARFGVLSATRLPYYHEVMTEKMEGERGKIGLTTLIKTPPFLLR